MTEKKTAAKTKKAVAKTKATPVKAEINKVISVLCVASEANPFVGTGGLADVIGSLPKALAANDNFDVRVVIPLYSIY